MKTGSVAWLIAAAAGALSWGLGCKSTSRQPTIDSAPVSKALTEAKQPVSAVKAVQQAAEKADLCHYTEVATRALLDAELPELALRTLKAAPADCARANTLQGQRAEALARSGIPDQAEPLAQQTLLKDLDDPYAEMALARTRYDKNEMTASAEYADKALKHGRGAEANRLLGRSTLARGQFEVAEEHFQSVLSANPNDAEAAFSAAVCNDKLGRYMPAREGFLRTLQINPKHAEARKYLALLTWNAGAKDEARHHLKKLGELLPKDSPELLGLQHLLSGEPSAGGASSSNKAH